MQRSHRPARIPDLLHSHCCRCSSEPRSSSGAQFVRTPRRPQGRVGGYGPKADRHPQPSSPKVSSHPWQWPDGRGGGEEERRLRGAGAERRAGAGDADVLGGWDGDWDGWRCPRLAGRVDVVEKGYQECPKRDGEGEGAAQWLSRAGGAPGGSSEQPQMSSRRTSQRAQRATDTVASHSWRSFSLASKVLIAFT